MITATYTNPRSHETHEVEITGVDHYLSTPRFEITALAGQPFVDCNSNGDLIPTAKAKVLRSMLSNIQRIGEVNQHPAEIAAALDEAKAEMLDNRMVKFTQAYKNDAPDYPLPGAQAEHIAAGIFAAQIVAHL